MQRLLAAPSVMAATRGFAIDGDQIGRIRTQCGGPTGEAGLEQRRVDAVHQHAQPVGSGNAEVELGVAAQEVQVGLAPFDDLVVIVTTADAGRDHQKQHFRQREAHLGGLTRVFHRGEMLQQAAQPGLLKCSVHVRQDRHVVHPWSLPEDRVTSYESHFAEPNEAAIPGQETAVNLNAWPWAHCGRR
jgi:hypothetical protein